MWLIHFQKEERARQEEKETKESSEYEHQRNVSPKIVTNIWWKTRYAKAP